MASTKDNIRLGGFKAYFGTLYLGQCHSDGVTISRNGNKVDITSALSGEGIIKSFSTGETVEAELTLLEFDKNTLSTVLGGVKGWDTDPADGTAGKITAGYSPGVELLPKPLYLYPTFVDSNNEPFGADAQNQFAFVIFQAIPNTENEIVISPTEETNFPITFFAQYDLTRPEGQRVWGVGAIGAPADSAPLITSA